MPHNHRITVNIAPIIAGGKRYMKNRPVVHNRATIAPLLDSRDDFVPRSGRARNKPAFLEGVGDGDIRQPIGADGHRVVR